MTERTTASDKLIESDKSIERFLIAPLDMSSTCRFRT